MNSKLDRPSFLLETFRHNKKKKMSGQEDEKLANDLEEKVTFKPKMNPFANSFNPNASAFVPSFGAAPAVKPSPAAAPVVLKVTKPAAPATATSSSSSSVEDIDKVTTPTKSKAAAPSPAPARPAATTPSADPPAPVAELSPEEKAAEDEFYKDYKDHLNIVFIGHVDAGKSTMGGHLLFLTGMVDKRTLEKYEREAKEQNRESWYLSWALDTSVEERAKGKTVECGRAFFETDTRRFTILDAPGHKSYVPSMISGASQADVGVLVISARKGEFETGFEKGGQTREHAMLAKTAGVKKLIVVINKMDDPTVSWSEERYKECCEKLGPFLKQCGYNLKTDVDFMPVSGFTGANLKDRVPKDVCSWYSGPALLEMLDTTQGIDRRNDAPFMMPLTEKYKDMGTIVAGKVESGRIRKSKNVLIMPNKKICEVQGVYGEDDEEIKSASCGDNIRLKLRGVEEDELAIGFVLCDPMNPVHTVQAFEAQLMILEHKNILCAGYSCVLHVHTLVEEVTLGALLHLVDKKTGRRSKKPPMFAKKGQIVVVRIETAGLICAETYDSYPQLGRFTLREEGKTVAMGKVTKLIEASGDQQQQQ
eukprot:Partr_v1_DN27449_c3_g1_i1_m72325 putative eukaryotic peptide chain release factor gtp-binding subunit